MRTFVIFAFILSLSFPAAVFAAENLPDGFIAISEDKMNWADAKAWCEQQGGKLPLIDGSESIGEIPQGTSIDGFGTKGAPWPDGLPIEFYWTGTEYSGHPRHSWLIVNSGGYISDNFVTQGNGRSVVCVP